VRAPYADLFGPGTHGSTFGGTPLGCAVALKVLEVIRRDHLDQNALNMGAYLKERLQALATRFPSVLKEIRGLGLIIGIELAEKIPAFAKSEKSHALQFIDRLHQAGLLTVPSGTHVARLLPALNLKKSEADEGLGLIEQVVSSLT
jgi:acetylornithine/succinyldiaminopimelate/putrescine aminotransferase